MENNKTEFKVTGIEMLQKIIELMREGNVERFIIKDNEGHIYLEIPITESDFNKTIMPLLTKATVLAEMVSDFTLEVIKKDSKNKKKS